MFAWIANIGSGRHDGLALAWVFHLANSESLSHTLKRCDRSGLSICSDQSSFTRRDTSSFASVSIVSIAVAILIDNASRHSRQQCTFRWKGLGNATLSILPTRSVAFERRTTNGEEPPKISGSTVYSIDARFCLFRGPEISVCLAQAGRRHCLTSVAWRSRVEVTLQSVFSSSYHHT